MLPAGWLCLFPDTPAPTAAAACGCVWLLVCLQVLRPSHILPTLTVEQQGEVELREARERDAAAKATQQAEAAAAAGRRSDDEDEDALAKQRAWDDWADDNPRGWGNSKLRPCA